MGTADEGTWYELRPDGVPSVGVANPPRYGDQAQAEEAASRLLVRHPGFHFVEIITYENGTAGAPRRAWSAASS